MEITQCRQRLLAMPAAELDYPFGPDAEVFKVRGKMFALLFRRQGKECLNLKCDPHEALMLRDIFPAIQPGYHMNKKHWNTVVLDGTVPAGELARLMEASWALVVAGLPRRHRDALRLASL